MLLEDVRELSGGGGMRNLSKFKLCFKRALDNKIISDFRNFILEEMLLYNVDMQL